MGSGTTDQATATGTAPRKRGRWLYVGAWATAPGMCTKDCASSMGTWSRRRGADGRGANLGMPIVHWVARSTSGARGGRGMVGMRRGPGAKCSGAAGWAGKAGSSNKKELCRQRLPATPRSRGNERRRGAGEAQKRLPCSKRRRLLFYGARKGARRDHPSGGKCGSKVPPWAKMANKYYNY